MTQRISWIRPTGRVRDLSNLRFMWLDIAHHVGGVWALSPGFVNKSVDKLKYEAIGESDRMTLKFDKH